MSASWNWLQDLHRHVDEPDRGQAMPVFSGQKLVVVGGSSGMGRQTAADVVAAGGSAVIIGQDLAKVDDTAGNWPTSTPTPPCWSTRRASSSPSRS